MEGTDGAVLEEPAGEVAVDVVGGLLPYGKVLLMGHFLPTQ